jgi:hypothetical protein
MTWREVAGEIRGFTPGMLTNLANGPLIGFPGVVRPISRPRRRAASPVVLRDPE